MRLMRQVMVAVVILVSSGCATQPPKNLDDICEIFKQNRDWYRSSKHAFETYGLPIHVQMAIVHQESRFRADAQPERLWILGVIPWFRPSSAYGYAQVKDDTWDWYREKSGNRFASRDNFSDAVEFVAWYGRISFDQLHISKWDAYGQYLAYHEGHGGYRMKTYLVKPWLISVAKKVKSRASRYHTQLSRCEDELNRPWWWPF